ELGMNVELINYDWATYLEKLDQPGEFEIAVSGASYLTTPSQLLVMNSDFAGGKTDDKIDELLLNMRTAEDHEAAFAYWEKLQSYLWTEYVPATKVGESYDLTITSDRVKEFNNYPAPIHPVFWNVRLE